MLARSRSIQLGVSALLASFAAACSLDDRTLAPRGSAGAAGLDTQPPEPSAGAAGEGNPEPPLPLPECDYSGELEPGCESLVQNPGFNRDALGWAPEEGSVWMTWKPTDARGVDSSGSLSVLNTLNGAAEGVAARGVAQCLPVTAGHSYGASAALFVPKDQSGTPDGGYVPSGGLSLIFYDDAACEGHTLGNATSELVERPGEWARRELRRSAPESAQSMRVRLVSFKDFRESKFEVRFDNVLVRKD